MAKFFSFLTPNYEKEGKGIEKDAPKKSDFVVFFETFFRNFWKFIPINLVYWLISIPVVTNGLTAAGATHVARNTARDKHSFGLSDFFSTIKKNWKQSLIAGIVNAVVYIILAFNANFFFNSKGAFSVLGMAVTFFALFVFTLMNYFIWTLMITFKFNLKQIYKNSFKFVFINFPKNMLIFFALVVVNIILIGLACVFWFAIGGFFAVFGWIVFFLYIAAYPLFKFLLIQFCTFPSIKQSIIDPYYLEHPDEDIERRRDLGVYDEPEIEEDDEDEALDTDSEDNDGFDTQNTEM